MILVPTTQRLEYTESRNAYSCHESVLESINTLICYKEPLYMFPKLQEMKYSSINSMFHAKKYISLCRCTVCGFLHKAYFHCLFQLLNKSQSDRASLFENTCLASLLTSCFELISIVLKINQTVQLVPDEGIGASCFGKLLLGSFYLYISFKLSAPNAKWMGRIKSHFSMIKQWDGNILINVLAFSWICTCETVYRFIVVVIKTKT